MALPSSRSTSSHFSEKQSQSGSGESFFQRFVMRARRKSHSPTPSAAVHYPQQRPGLLATVFGNPQLKLRRKSGEDKQKQHQPLLERHIEEPTSKSPLSPPSTSTPSQAPIVHFSRASQLEVGPAQYEICDEFITIDDDVNDADIEMSTVAASTEVVSELQEIGGAYKGRGRRSIDLLPEHSYVLKSEVRVLMGPAETELERKNMNSNKLVMAEVKVQPPVMAQVQMQQPVMVQLQEPRLEKLVMTASNLTEWKCNDVEIPVHSLVLMKSLDDQVDGNGCDGDPVQTGMKAGDSPAKATASSSSHGYVMDGPVERAVEHKLIQMEAKICSDLADKIAHKIGTAGAGGCTMDLGLHFIPEDDGPLSGTPIGANLEPEIHSTDFDGLHAQSGISYGISPELESKSKSLIDELRLDINPEEEDEDSFALHSFMEVELDPNSDTLPDVPLPFPIPVSGPPKFPKAPSGKPQQKSLSQKSGVGKSVQKSPVPSAAQKSPLPGAAQKTATSLKSPVPSGSMKSAAPSAKSPVANPPAKSPLSTSSQKSTGPKPAPQSTKSSTPKPAGTTAVVEKLQKSSALSSSSAPLQKPSAAPPSLKSPNAKPAPAAATALLPKKLSPASTSTAPAQKAIPDRPKSPVPAKKPSLSATGTATSTVKKTSPTSTVPVAKKIPIAASASATGSAASVATGAATKKAPGASTGATGATGPKKPASVGSGPASSAVGKKTVTTTKKL